MQIPEREIFESKSQDGIADVGRRVWELGEPLRVVVEMWDEGDAVLRWIKGILDQEDPRLHIEGLVRHVRDVSGVESLKNVLKAIDEYHGRDGTTEAHCRCILRDQFFL